MVNLHVQIGSITLQIGNTIGPFQDQINGSFKVGQSGPGGVNPIEENQDVFLVLFVIYKIVIRVYFCILLC